MRFGHYFYNVNSTFYMWNDSWAECLAGTIAHHDYVHWPDMPADQIPSMSKYWQQHSIGQLAERVIAGADRLRWVVTHSYGYTPFFLLYFAFVSMLVLQNGGHFLRLIRRKPATLQTLFLLLYFFSYAVLYAWYAPIASGNRFILSLFLPALFSLVQVIDYASRQNLTFHVGGKAVPSSSVSPVILISLLIYLILVFPEQISRMLGGT
jgi:hypothetical protein